MSILQLVAQSSDTLPETSSGSHVGLAIFLFIFGVFIVIGLLVVGIALLVATWRFFEKAGYAGWKSLVPIYSLYIYIKIAQRPGWWTILSFIPGVNIVTTLLVALDMGRLFGKSKAFSIFWLWLLPGIGLFILGFGKATYKPMAAGVPSQTPLQ
ncbi:MAG TPA: DUF5684 domain-containing protein [Candidatus Saccharimonadales bacterium]|nr:DUF5684 domain-containing protein [Candidatus Saccharimonadales bacterium]